MRIRDRIVCGIDCKQTRGILLRNSDLTLEKAVTFVRACETSKTQVFELDNSHSADAMNKNKGSKKSFEQNVSNRKMFTKFTHNFTDRQPASSCYYCGNTHSKGACPAYGRRCTKCNRMNHFANVSQSRQPSHVNSLDLDGEISHAEAQDPGVQISELFIDMIEVSTLNINSDTEMILPFIVNDSKINIKIDKCAQCNVMPEEIFQTLQHQPNLIPTKINLKSYGGTPVPVLGKCTMTVATNSKSTNCEFFVVDLKKAKTLLGLPSCRELKLFDINSIGKDNNNLMEEYADIYTGLGKVAGKFNIKILPNDRPVIHALRKVPLSLLPKLENTLKRLIHSGVISKVTTPIEWVNSMVIVEKKNSSLRICIDARELNDNIMPQYNTVPTPEEIPSKLNGSCIFTVKDMADCYWHIELDDYSSKLCTFNTPFGRHKFNIIMCFRCSSTYG